MIYVPIMLAAIAVVVGYFASKAIHNVYGLFERVSALERDLVVANWKLKELDISIEKLQDEIAIGSRDTERLTIQYVDSRLGELSSQIQQRYVSKVNRLDYTIDYTG